jgi:hypothetical protein
VDWILQATALTQSEFLILIGLAILAGIVRGFSGFALSAMVMATAVIILPPIELLPMLWWLEMSASILMLKNGWDGADKTMTYALVIGATIGWPIGLALTIAISVAASKTIALAVIGLLAITLLAKIRMPFLATKPGLYGSGVLSGLWRYGHVRHCARPFLRDSNDVRCLPWTTAVYRTISTVLSPILPYPFDRPCYARLDPHPIRLN